MLPASALDTDAEYLKQSQKKYGDIESAAKKHFGTTDNFRIAGYVLADGTMLDFSGAHWLIGNDADAAYVAEWREKNDIRQVDHEDIFEAFDGNNFPSDSRKEFINRGNIRISPEAPGINIASVPTAQQYSVIKELVRDNPYDTEGFYVDIEDKQKHIGKLTYTGKVNADLVVNDIKHFYETGEIREQSIVNQFHGQFSTPLGEDALDIGEAEQLTDEDLLWQIRMEDAQDEGERDWLDQAKGRAEKLKDLRAQLAEAKRQMKTTDHALNTKGLSSFARDLAVNFGIKDRGLQRSVRTQVEDLFQSVLDQIDSGNFEASHKTLYDGARKIGEWLVDNGYTAEKYGYKWYTRSFADEFARTPEARAAIVADTSMKIVEDFALNRARDAVQQTQADRLVQQTKDKYAGKLAQTQQELMTANAENLGLRKQNAALTENNRLLKDISGDYILRTNKAQADLAQAMREAKNADRISDRQKAKIEKLKGELALAKAEAKAWQEKSRHAASVMQSVLSSKNADIAKLERQIARYERMLDGDLRNPKLQRQIRYSLTSSHLYVFLKFSGSFASTHLYFQSGSLTLVEAAPVAARLLRSITTLTPETVMPFCSVAAISLPAR